MIIVMCRQVSTVLNGLENYAFSYVCLYVVNYVRQAETHKAEPLVLQPSYFCFETAFEKLKSCKSLDNKEILEE
jgi:hypothetical protein